MGELRGGLEVSLWGANLTVIKRVLFDQRHGFLDYLELNVKIRTLYEGFIYTVFTDATLQNR